ANSLITIKNASGVIIITQTVTASGTYVITLPMEPEGANLYEITSTDVANNVSSIASIILHLDVTFPVFPAITAPSS
ncbi:MAG: Ig-like domain-containing protein, partial [Bacteroidota bacterium]